MREIVQDPKVGANFVALLIVKLGDNDALVATVHAYLPNGAKHRGSVTIRAVQFRSIDVTA